LFFQKSRGAAERERGRASINPAAIFLFPKSLAIALKGE
jgi:hypothetical protein